MQKIVRIIEDCRKVDNPATGNLGIYEGDFPRTVFVKNTDGSAAEFWYEGWDKVNAEWKIPELKRGEPRPEGRYWFINTNPRIRLEDGSYIWGDECWWSDKVEADVLELQKDVDFFREVYAAMLLSESK